MFIAPKDLKVINSGAAWAINIALLTERGKL
jgi:hypothetical protein